MLVINLFYQYYKFILRVYLNLLNQTLFFFFSMHVPSILKYNLNTTLLYFLIFKINF